MSGSILPYAAAARVADAKVRDFILDAAHPDNKGRAAFYIGIGFTRQQWHLLRDALLAHPPKQQRDWCGLNRIWNKIPCEMQYRIPG